LNQKENNHIKTLSPITLVITIKQMGANQIIRLDPPAWAIIYFRNFRNILIESREKSKLTKKYVVKICFKNLFQNIHV
jgi:hypothetical protein